MCATTVCCVRLPDRLSLPALITSYPRFSPQQRGRTLSLRSILSREAAYKYQVVAHRSCLAYLHFDSTCVEQGNRGKGGSDRSIVVRQQRPRGSHGNGGNSDDAARRASDAALQVKRTAMCFDQLANGEKADERTRWRNKCRRTREIESFDCEDNMSVKLPILQYRETRH